MMPTFPNYMIPLLDNFQESIEPVVYRSEMESGPAKQRSFQCAQNVIRRVRYTVCGCENMDKWREFFVKDIKNGSLWFKWYDPCAEKYVRARIPDHQYSATPDDISFTSWEVDVTFEVRIYA